MIDNDMICHIGKVLGDNLSPKKVILFGSYAYGTPTNESDIDICIIKENIISKKEEKRKVRKLLDDIDISKDILIVDNNYYEAHNDENWINTALYDANKYGKIIYEQK